MQVLLGDRSLPLLYTSSGQVNVQVPYGLPVNTQHQIAVRRGNALSVPETLSVAETQPGIFTENQKGTGQGIIFEERSAHISASRDTGERRRDRRNLLHRVRGSGSHPWRTARPLPSSVLATTVNPVTLRIGGKEHA